jgi:hypothetical protein
MKKLKIAVVQILDENLLSHIKVDTLSGYTATLALNLREWCNHYNYDHKIYYLSDEYKRSEEFESHMNNEYTGIRVSNFNSNNHSKIYGYIKALELLEDYDYVCVLDLDIGYVSKLRSIEDYLESVNAWDKNIIAGLECIDPRRYYGGRVPNGGVFLYKSTPWTKRLLDGLIAAQTRIGYSDLRMTECMNDQMQMSYIAMVCPDCDQHFLITQHTDCIQDWYSLAPHDVYMQEHKTLFYHFAGAKKESIPDYLKGLEDRGNFTIKSYDNFENIIIKL